MGKTPQKTEAAPPKEDERFTAIATRPGARPGLGLVKVGDKMQVTEAQFSETWMKRA